MWKNSIEHINLYNKVVFYRADYNVPLHNGRIMDTTRIDRTLPTVQFLLQRGAKILIASHLGYPKGRFNHELVMGPIGKYIQSQLKLPITMFSSSYGDAIKNQINSLEPSSLGLLENLRFNQGEELNDPNLGKEYAKLADIYVNDAFATSHREHTSIVSITEYLPSFPGLLLKNEIEKLSNTLYSLESPKTVVMGGAKISSKLKVILNLLDKVDNVLVGGAIGNILLKGTGFSIGESLVDTDEIKTALEIVEAAKYSSTKLLLPSDVVLSAPQKSYNVRNVKEINTYESITDIGYQTVSLFKSIIGSSKVVIWNGPMGIYEKDEYCLGTREVYRAILSSNAQSIIGGGDTLASIKGLASNNMATSTITFSTGGGALLAYLTHNTLAGFKNLIE